MAIPNLYDIMIPLLESVSDSKEHHWSEVAEVLSKHFNLTEDEKNQVLPSRKDLIFANRVKWAKLGLSKAGLLITTHRGIWQITPSGLDLLKTRIENINDKYLYEHYPTYKEWKDSFTTKQRTKGIESATTSLEKPPEELIDDAFQGIKLHLIDEILETVKNCSPKFFENLVLDLLFKMGYGGSREEVMHTGRSGDGGIDGVINEDKLGLDKVYVQAKRWNNSVPLDTVKSFTASLMPQRARKGIIITTSTFPDSARKFVDSIDPKIVLIDGITLANLMIEHDVGVSTRHSYEIKKIDHDYFVEE